MGKKGKKFGKLLTACLLICALTFSASGLAMASVNVPDPAYELDGLTYYDGATYWLQGRQSITVKAPSEYTISAEEDGPFGSSVSFGPGNVGPVYLKDGNIGETSEAIQVTETILWDTTMPDGKISLSKGEASFDNIFSFVTTSDFYKAPMTAEIAAVDVDSGVHSVEYYVADSDLSIAEGESGELFPQKLERLIAGQWKTYEEPIALETRKLNIIYAKITDHVGNVRYLGTSGYNVYADGEVLTTDVEYAKGSGQSAEAKVRLNGNTIKSIKAGDAALLEGVDYAVSTEGSITFYPVFLETLPLGETEITISYNPLGKDFVQGEAPADTTLTLHVNVDTSGWGTKAVHGGIDHYVAVDGTTSVEVEGNGVIWLKETSDGMSTWVALDNRSGVFEKGSRLWVRILDEDADKDAWQRHYDQLDQNIKDDIEADQLMLFEVGVTGVNGTAYHEFASKAVLSVQMPDAWDESDTEIVYVDKAGDEEFAETIVTQQCPQGEGRFLTAELSHFSCYAVYDGLSEAEKEALKEENNQDKQEEQNNQESVPGQTLEGPAGGESEGEAVPQPEGNVNGNEEVQGEAVAEADDNSISDAQKENPDDTSVAKNQADEDGDDITALPKTGDHNYLMVWVIVGLAAARILAKLVRRKKKEKSE